MNETMALVAQLNQVAHPGPAPVLCLGLRPAIGCTLARIAAPPSPPEPLRGSTSPASGEVKMSISQAIPMRCSLTNRPVELALQPVDQRTQKYRVEIVGALGFSHRRGELFEGL
jgi:hypothetical protein